MGTQASLRIAELLYKQAWILGTPKNIQPMKFSPLSPEIAEPTAIPGANRQRFGTRQDYQGLAAHARFRSMQSKARSLADFMDETISLYPLLMVV